MYTQHLAILWPRNSSQRDKLKKLMAQGKVDGKRLRGRSPFRWLDQIIITDSPLATSLTKVENRVEWKKMVNQ